MAKVQIILPAMGEGIIEAEITRWLVKEGQAVEAGEPVVEIATDKVDSEIPAPVSGILRKILVSEGEISKIGQVIALLSTDTGGYEPPEQEERSSPETTTHAEMAPQNIPERELSEDSMHSHSLADIAFLSPVVRKIAREHGLNSQEISGIAGSGLRGRITRRDMEDYLRNRSSAAGPSVAFSGDPDTVLGQETSRELNNDAGSGDDAYAELQNGTNTVMSRMRQKIAEHMVYSKKTAPHVTSFIESDVTVMMEWRDRIKDEFESVHGQKLTVTTLVIEAVAKALTLYPDINVSVQGYNIIRKKELNIGMATALPDGNLIVPVIREADRLSLPGLAARVNDLAERARNNLLKPGEVAGGTFTVTNLGTTGNLAGTPIINQPQVAILAVGAIRRMPAVANTPKGEAIGIRQMMMLSLAYDHRVIDGTLGGSFLKSIRDHLQHFDNKRIV
jgi:2-oxoglutarate dehydrogenase E2 component (dihydrolipoamide succinyltransferase)